MASIQKRRVDTFYVGSIKKNSETGKFVGTVVWVSRFRPMSPAATELRPMNQIRISPPIPSSGSRLTDHAEVYSAPKPRETITEGASKPKVIDVRPVSTKVKPKGPRATLPKTSPAKPERPATTRLDFRRDPLDQFEF